MNTLTEALEALNAVTARATGLEADLKAAQGLMEEQAAALAAAKQEIEAVKAAASHVEQVSEIRVNEVLASVGVAPVDIPLQATPAPKTREELWAEYKSLSMYDRPAFFQKHKSQMSTL
jgi:hypothetical protein